jgi:hypothetical protein
MTYTETVERPRLLDNRFLRNNDGIEINAGLRRQFPSVFSHKAHPKMSEEYQMFRSDKIIEEMANLNMALVEIRQMHSVKRDPAYQMHSLRFRPSGRSKALAKVGDTVAEAHIINSHNGLRRFVASSGLFRLACLNGLVVPDALYGSASMRHYGANNTFETVQRIVNGLMEGLPKLSDKIEAWKRIELEERQQVAVAKLMLQIRAMPEWVKPSMLLEAKREVDAAKRNGKRDLWTTFNVIQEHLMNDTLKFEGNEEERATSTRPVTGVVSVFDLNRSLWIGAERVAAGLESGRGIPSQWDNDAPDILGQPTAAEASAARTAERALAKAAKKAAKGKTQPKAKKPAAAHAAKPAKAKLAKDKADKAREAMLAKKREAQARYRAKKAAEKAEERQAGADAALYAPLEPISGE